MIITRQRNPLSLDTSAESFRWAFGSGTLGAMTDSKPETAAATEDHIVGGSLSFSGVASSLPPAPFIGFLRLLTGWAALSWLVRGILWTLGYRHTVNLHTGNGAVRVARDRRLLGRSIRQSDETLSLRALGEVTHRSWFPSLQLYVGSLSLALGIVIGGLFLIDGVRTGETYLLLLGAGAILVGGGFDFGLQLVLPARRGEQHIDLRTISGRGLSVRGGTEDERAGSPPTFPQVCRRGSPSE